MISAVAALDDDGAVAGHGRIVISLPFQKFLEMDFEPQNIPLAHTWPLPSETFDAVFTTSRFRQKSPHSVRREMDFMAMLAEARAAKRKASTSQQGDTHMPVEKVARPSLLEVADDVLHAAEWCTLQEESTLIRAIESAPHADWTPLSGRRIQNLGGLPRADGMVPQPLPPWARSLCDALVQAGVFDASTPPNHILLNEYQQGQGLPAHCDGPLYDPCVAIISLVSDGVLEFLPEGTDDKDDGHNAQRLHAMVLLRSRSLLVFKGKAYDECRHRVLPVSSRRLSLTVRRVRKLRDDTESAPLPAWEERAALARWLDPSPSPSVVGVS
jgi:alkylated DNA repair protein alkB family protein 6